MIKELADTQQDEIKSAANLSFAALTFLATILHYIF
jgi:hypothetical protein